MIRLSKYVLLSLLLLLSASACKKQKVPTSETAYFVEILVRFLQPENEYKSQISFFKGKHLEDALPVKAKNHVLFQQNRMEERNIGGYATRYEKLQAGPYMPDQRFSFTLEDENTLEVAVHMAPLNNYEIENYTTEGAFYKNKGATLFLNDTPLEKDEHLLVLFTDDAGNTFSITKKETGNTRIPLTPLDLAEIPAGNYELYLVKKQERLQKVQQLTVLSTIEYYSGVSQITIQ